jgi:hypothetical protein
VFLSSGWSVFAAAASPRWTLCRGLALRPNSDSAAPGQGGSSRQNDQTLIRLFVEARRALVSRAELNNLILLRKLWSGRPGSKRRSPAWE